MVQCTEMTQGGTCNIQGDCQDGTKSFLLKADMRYIVTVTVVTMSCYHHGQIKLFGSLNIIVQLDS